MIPLGRVQEILKPHGYTAENASTEMYPLFESDLDAADKYELGRTRHQDWRKELYDTLNSKGTTFCVTSPNHGGAIIFGVTPFPGNAGRMWMLQSKSFVLEAAGIHGRALPHKMGAVTRDMIALFLQHHSPLFNFIPSSQTRNIRWLKQGGFLFYEHPKVETDIYFFGQGDSVENHATSHKLWVSCLGEALIDQSQNENFGDDIAECTGQTTCRPVTETPGASTCGSVSVRQRHAV